MSEYFRVVNKTKHEYFEASMLGENEKKPFIGTGMQGRLLALLLIDSQYENNDLAGSWAGDSVVIAGDTNGKLVDDTQLYYEVAEKNHTDITIKALAILCGDGHVNSLISLARSDVKLKNNLYCVLDTYEKNKTVHLGGLKILLEREFNDKA